MRSSGQWDKMTNAMIAVSTLRHLNAVDTMAAPNKAQATAPAKLCE